MKNMKYGVFLFALVGLLVCGAGRARAASDFEWAGGFPKLVEENVLLQWVPVKDADSYKVYRGEAKGKATSLLSTVTVNRYIDTKPAAGKTYYYKVTAVKDGNELASSKEAEVAIKAKAAVVALKSPTLVEPRLKELPGGKAEVGIRWEVERATSLAGYNVYRSVTKGKGYAMIGSAPGASFEDRDVERGKTYYYVVTAVDDKFNETKYSNEVSIEVARPVKATSGPKDEPTKFRKAKLVLTIEKFKDIDGKVKPLEYPVDVAVDEAVGHIYVVSAGQYNGVLVYDLSGRFQYGIKKDGAGGKEKFESPHAVTVGQNGLIIVSDYNSSEIRMYDGIDGRFKGSVKANVEKIEKALSRTLGAGIIDVAVNSEGDIFAADPKTNSVHVFNSSGKQVFDFGSFNEKEKNPKFNGPIFTAFDSKDRYYLVDTGYARVMVYNSDGEYLSNFGRLGTAPGEFRYPTGIAVDGKDVIYVANGMDSNLQAFDAGGKFLYALANEKGDGPIPSGDMKGIFVDGKDRLYVTESYTHKVSVYQMLEGLVDIIPPAGK
ncbi:MAG: hypothetical protein HZA22_11810 [Nitrospirae bacterium]|nr:hypothetical protein [Nitrospirota bacterium]MBI5696458.1 hypothetical protein [Nitrospirota bacterium]